MTDIQYLSDLFNQEEVPEVLHRADVIKAFNDGDLLKGFVLCMVWGGIGMQPKERGNAFTTNACMAFSEIQTILPGKLAKLQQLLKEGKVREAYESLENGDLKIAGVGVSYYTKLLFFLGESMLHKPSLLIYDKWTRLVHVHLMFDNKQNSNDYYTYSSLKHLSEPSLVYCKDQTAWTAYHDYCKQMDVLANKLTACLQTPISTSLTESYLFGRELRGRLNKQNDNPRYWILENYRNTIFPGINTN